MFTRPVIIPLILLFALTVAACGSAALPTPATTTAPALAALEDNLAAGILRLEDTAQAVTARQAADMLVLWQAVFALSAQTNTTTAEMDTLYAQIGELLTADQIQAIRQMTWSAAEVAALRAHYAAQPAAETVSSATTAPDAGGPSQESSMPAVIPGGQVPGADMLITGSTASADTASQPADAADLNVLLAPALVDLLQERLSA